MAFELLTGPAYDVPVGASKMGGRPDLPPGEPWPTRDGRPLSFVVQVDLATVDTAGVLPPDGLLSFFYDAVDQPGGYEEGDESGTVVRWTLGGTPLERRDFPDDLNPFDGRFDAMRVAVAEVGEGVAATHRLLGTPDAIEEDLDDAGTLLFQIGTDDAGEMTWGDGGALYVFLPPDALARREWGAARTVLQSH
jgi:uncharacterized protein YwqG